MRKKWWYFTVFRYLAMFAMLFAAILVYTIILTWFIWGFRYSRDLVMLGLVIAFGVSMFGIFTFLFNYLEEATKRRQNEKIYRQGL